MDTLVIVDSHAVIHRAFHAMAPLSLPDGTPIHAVYGFMSMVLSILDMEQPRYAALTFDRKEKTLRHAQDMAYKAQRVEAPDALKVQFPLIHECAEALGLPTFHEAGYEADDMIAGIVRRMPAGVRGVVVSGDRDLFQLVGERVEVHDLAGGYRKHTVWNEAAVREKYGFAPTAIPDYKGLAGDSSDNMPGVPGVGPKTASELLARYGDLEGIYANIGAVKGAVAEKLLAHKDAALHYRAMARLLAEVPMEFSLEACGTVGIDTARVVGYCERMGFKSLIPRVTALGKKLVRREAESVVQTLF